MSGSRAQELQEEIEELRGELGETVQALVHKADVPARAKERGNKVKEEALARGSEAGSQVLERGSELRDQAIERGSALKVRGPAAAGMAREMISRMPADRWAKLAGAGLMLIASPSSSERC